MQGSITRPVDILHKLPQLKALTSVRFLAALYVALFHTNVIAYCGNSPVLAHFIHSGYTGVTFFFVLSGFILAYNYPTIPDVKKFWIARFARVYPVYFLSILLAIGMHGMRGVQHPVLAIAMVFSLLQAFYPPVFQAINPVAWTLSVEAFFYLTMPFLLPFMRRLSWRSFLILESIYLLIVVAPNFIMAAHHPVFANWMAIYLESSIPLFRINTFLVGMFFGLHWNAMHREHGARSTNIARRRTYSWTAAILTLFLLQLAPSPLLLPLRTFALTYTFVLLIIGLAESDNPLLISHTAQMAGEISYGFYILQFPVIALCGDLRYRLWPNFETTQITWIFIPAIIAAAYVSFRWFEIPARLWLRELLTGRPVPTRPI
jgi:peptidoglycan/LPS O-acetylase OafA/YrhL